MGCAHARAVDAMYARVPAVVDIGMLQSVVRVCNIAWHANDSVDTTPRALLEAVTRGLVLCARSEPTTLCDVTRRNNDDL